MPTARPESTPVRPRRSPPTLQLAAALALAVLPGACAIVAPQEAAPPAFEHEETAEGDLEDPEGEDLEVELVVMTGPRGSTLAFVPVFVGGEGPLRFALDTGASDTALHLEVAEELGLQKGTGRQVVGVTGIGDAVDVEVSEWRLGDVPLEPRTIAGLEIPDAGTDTGFDGLLGSDVLSSFDAVTIDYRRQVLILRPREQVED